MGWGLWGSMQWESYFRILCVCVWLCVWLGGRWVVIKVLGGVCRCVCGWVPGWWVWLGGRWCVVAGVWWQVSVSGRWVRIVRSAFGIP